MKLLHNMIIPDFCFLFFYVLLLDLASEDLNTDTSSFIQKSGSWIVKKWCPQECSMNVIETVSNSHSWTILDSVSNPKTMAGKKRHYKGRFVNWSDSEPEPDEHPRNPVLTGSPVLGIRIRRIRMFWASWIRIRIRSSQVRIRLRILPSSSKNSKKNPDFYCFVTSLWLFIFEGRCKCTTVVFRIHIQIRRIRVFSGILDPHPDLLIRGTDQRIRIRIWIRTKMSRIPNTAGHIQNTGFHSYFWLLHADNFSYIQKN